jgi:phytoene/squalene synthetase
MCLRRAVSIEHALHLLQAFRADATNRPCRSWSDLLAYCLFSAAPVGRFLLELHGETRAARTPADALCIALQILNHLQDARADHTQLQRYYVPLDWLAEAGLGVEALDEVRTSPALRAVFDRVLDRVDRLLDKAAALPGRLADAGLRREAGAILAIARALAHRLRRNDPLARRVRLGRAATAFHAARGALAAAGLRPRRGSSFALAMRLLGPRRRGALLRLHGFAKLLDDVADGDAARPAKRDALAAWHREIDAAAAGEANDPATRAVAADWRAYALPIAELHALVDGLAMDVDDPRAPDRVTLALYCRRVAGSVGLLTLPVFGCDGPAERRYALALGEALQLTNILRDLGEDAARGRLYVAREWLLAAGLDPAEAPTALIAAPGFGRARRALADAVGERFAAAEAALEGCDRRRLLPARAMAAVYRRLLERLRGGDRVARGGWGAQLIAALGALARR